MMDAIDRLAARLGIADAYRDQEGQIRVVSSSTKRALLAAFGVHAESEEAVERALAEAHRQTARRLVEPVTILREDQRPFAVEINVRGPGSDASLRWRVSRENGRVDAGEAAFAELPLMERGGSAVDDHERRRILLPEDLETGYHALWVEYTAASGRTSAEVALIVVPRRAFQPEALRAGGRLWGISLQLYGIRSPRNWGIGDFTDLAELMTWAGTVGAAAVGINPLHALFLDDPAHISPYSPSSRYFLNPLYLDVEAIEEFAFSEEAKDLVRSPSFQAELASVRREPLVDYRRITALKRPVLEHLHRAFRFRAGERGEQRRKALQRYRDERGPALERFAVFQALREALGSSDTSLRDWRRWPSALRDPESSETAAFAQKNAEKVEFFAYLQWQADQQLRACAEAGRAAGLPIGLYLDLAVGTDAAGADAWAAPGLVTTGATIGAPPDAWNRKGQNWGLPPLNTAALREQAFRPFVELLRANMLYAGALRIDHVLGLKRLFWIPEGKTPADGAYVAYPFDELIGLVALESERNRCLVVGEDLGTLPEGFQPAMRSAGLLSYCLLYFERDETGRFRGPGEYPAEALVTISTHDLPTLWGYWSRRDLDEKERVKAYPNDAEAAAARRSRDEDIAGLIAALAREGLVPPDQSADVVPFEAILRFIARTRSQMLMIGLEDLLRVEDQANLPGTIDEHPNWRRRLPKELPEIFADERVAAALRIVDSERPSNRRPKRGS